MKIALICPSNILYMPYLNNYISILNELELEYDIINWDRFKIEKESGFVYRDKKIGHRRRFFDYFKYSRFVRNILQKENYEKVVVFGIQLVFFLKDYLIKKYSNRYIVDIRDYNRIINYFDIVKSIAYSNFTVLSSPGYKEWLPKSNKYIINHNTNIEDINDLVNFKTNNMNNEKISIGCIGALRDYKINIDFIKSIKNNKQIMLNYNGEGDINKDILMFIKDNLIENVILTGRYNKYEEAELYYRNDIINVLRYNDGINNKTALPNRLYNAVIYGKPMIAFEGTELSSLVNQFNLGIVINNFDKIDFLIEDYLNNIDVDEYNRGRTLFLKDVIADNLNFKIKLVEFSLDY